MSDHLEKRAVSLLDDCENISVASVNDKGYPRICVVSKLRNEGLSAVYFSTGAISTKTRHFRENHRASVCYYKGGDSVTLIGDAEIVDDMEKKEEVWQDWLINHFAKGVGDPNYCVIRFIPREASIWIDQEYATISFTD